MKQWIKNDRIYKYLKQIDTIFDKFIASLSTMYPNFPLLPHITKYRQLFKAFYQVYQAINHSKEVTTEECDAAESNISDYMSLVHKFSWPTTANKVNFNSVQHCKIKQSPQKLSK